MVETPDKKHLFKTLRNPRFVDETNTEIEGEMPENGETIRIKAIRGLGHYDELIRSGVKIALAKVKR